MLTRFKSVVSVAALLGASLAAHQQAAPVANGVILGRVIDAATKQPVPGVLVEIGGSPGILAPGGTGLPRIKALTDDQGRFVFRQLLPGSYNISATTGSSGFEQSGFLVTGMGHLIAPYLNGGFGQRRPNGPLQNLVLDQGAVVSDAVISLWRGASIDGMVVDEANEPLVGITVAAVRRTSDGILTTGPTARTDDRGMYRLAALAPGEYVIVVPQTQVLLPLSASEAAFAPAPDPLLARQFAAAGAPSPTLTGIAVGGVVSTSAAPVASNALVAPATRTTHVYVSTFHPAATSLDEARVIRVASGDEVTNADVQLTPTPASRLNGVLMDGAAGVPHFGVRLLPMDSGDGAEVMEIASTATDASGRFTFPLVPYGQYRIFAQRQAAVPTGTAPQGGAALAEPQTVAEMSGAWAEGLAIVGNQPGDDVILTLRPGHRVTGRVVFDGQSAQPPRERLNQVTFTAVPARPQRRHAPSVSGSQIDASGRISIAGLAPGRYILKWPETLAGWSVESVTMGGKDVADSAFEIKDADVGNLVVTFTEQPASLGGAVRNTSGVADFDAAVFMFPADRTRWRDAAATTRVVRTVRSDPTGLFVFQNVIPGDYLVVAIADRLAMDWPDQRLLTSLAGAAVPVRVLPRQRTSVPLTTVELR